MEKATQAALLPHQPTRKPMSYLNYVRLASQFLLGKMWRGEGIVKKEVGDSGSGEGPLKFALAVCKHMSCCPCIGHLEGSLRFKTC